LSVKTGSNNKGIYLGEESQETHRKFCLIPFAGALAYKEREPVLLRGKERRIMVIPE
jgi:hypothetical protein